MIKQLIENELPANYVRYAELDQPLQQELLASMEYAYITGNKLSVPFYADRMNSHEDFNKVIYVLSKAGFATSSINPKRKWGEFYLIESKLLEYYTQTELEEYRFHNRTRANKQTLDTADKPSNLTSLHSGVQDSGLDRPGFAKSSKHTYKYDTTMLAKYYDAILLNTVKSIDKMKSAHKHNMLKDKANYKLVATDVLNYHLFHSDTEFNSGHNINDSRGRASFAVLSKVFNYISSKDARSLLIVPNGKVVSIDSHKQMDDIYLFIAELIGTKATTWESKKLIGMDCYNTRDLHTVDLTTEHGRKELHENMWLERIYNRLDQVHNDGYAYWDIPLECDFTASMLVVQGCLLNDTRLLDMTNVINPDNLMDAWHNDVATRDMMKAVYTPKLYGSGESERNLLKHRKLVATKDQIKALKREAKSGALGLAAQFKSAVIKHCNPQPTMQIKIWNDEFTIECNKYRNVGVRQNAYTIYDSESDSDKLFFNMATEQVPDLEAFRLYFQTLLV